MRFARDIRLRRAICLRALSGFISFRIRRQPNISQFVLANYITSSEREISRQRIRGDESFFFNDINPLRGFAICASRAIFACGERYACGREWIYIISHSAAAEYIAICLGKLYRIERTRDISLKILAQHQQHASACFFYAPTHLFLPILLLSHLNMRVNFDIINK